MFLWDFDVSKLAHLGFLVIRTAYPNGLVGLLLFLQSASCDVLVNASPGSFFEAGFLMAKDLVSGQVFFYCFPNFYSNLDLPSVKCFIII